MSDVPVPTAEEFARDLMADLANIDYWRSSWMTRLAWEDRTDYAWPAWSEFCNHLPVVAETTIRRVLWLQHQLAGEAKVRLLLMRGFEISEEERTVLKLRCRELEAEVAQLKEATHGHD